MTTSGLARFMAKPGVARPPKARRKAKSANLFIRVPLQQAATVCNAVGPADTLVWALLLQMAFEVKSLTFKCHNGLMNVFGVSRERKKQALRKLKAAGWLTFDERPKPRRSPTVTLLGVSLPPNVAKDD
jgi:hypothetical protein